MTQQSDLLKNLSPVQRARVIAKLRAKGTIRKRQNSVELPTLTRVSREQPLPLSHAQERLWILDQLGTRRNIYNIPIALRLRGELDAQALERSLEELVRRHESLRTIFEVVDSQPVQRICDVEFALQRVDLAELDEISRKSEIKEMLRAEVHHVFDLTIGPLIRARLVSTGLYLGRPEHYLYITMHHIVSDGWSMDVFNRELSTLYRAYSNGQTASLSDQKFHYVDFSVWQRNWLKDDALSSQLAYWAEQLKGAPACLPMPTDRARPPVQTYDGAHYRFALTPALSQNLYELSRTAGGSLFMLLLTAFKIMLMRYSGEEDIVVGSPFANRNHLEVEPMIGFFVNTLALRSDLSGNPSFRELFEQIKRMTLEASSHQDVPFSKVVEHVQPERDTSYSPLFQIVFELAENDLSGIDLCGLDVAALEIEFPLAKFDLGMSILEASNTDEGTCLTGRIEFNTNLYDETTIARMAGHFEVILESIANDPDQPIQSLPLLTDGERRQILMEWNGATADYPKHKCLHELFEEQVELVADAKALVFDGVGRPENASSLTYRELNNEANKFAAHLQSLGIGPGTLVGICLERSVEMVVGILGILKAGGAYLPLNPGDPQDRVGFILEDARISVMLTQRDLVDRLPDTKVELIFIDRDGTQALGSTHEYLPVKSESNQLAYVIYTSGSTGSPKGVPIEHRQVVSLLYSLEKIAPIKGIRNGTSLGSYNFDISVWEFFSMVCFGGSLHLLTLDTFASAKNTVGYLDTHNISNAYLPPMLLSDILLTYENRKTPTTLKRVLIGLEPIPEKLLQRFRELSSELKIMYGYGPTESTIASTFYDFDRTLEPDRNAPIGKPLPNYQNVLCDSNLQLVPVGVRGELLIGGTGVGRGYLTRPKLTEEKFISNPFGEGKLYRSGDMARWLPDGNIEFLGRIDHQVKIRGFRIELGEIESILQQHPEVHKTVVVVKNGTNGQTQLVAYLVVAGESDSSVFRDYLGRKLPDYMIPALFVFLPALPFAPNGKIDYKALPEPLAQTPAGATFVEARNEVERQIVVIWQDLLDLETVGTRDNFFDLGGNSLLIIQMNARLEALFPDGLNITDLFKFPTVAALAAHLNRSSHPDRPESAEVDRGNSKAEVRRSRVSTSLEQRKLRRRARQ